MLGIPVRILAVEDDAIYAETLSLIIHELGYELVGIADNGADALRLVNTTSPDLILMDIEIRDTITGIELAAQINAKQRIPVIFVTAFKDQETFKQAKLTFPKAYIIKPYDRISLQSAIELALFCDTDRSVSPPAASVYNDTFFIKDNNRLVKIRVADILLVEVDEKYCFIVTAHKKFIINIRLKDLQERLPKEDFIQVHRSYVVKKSAIEEISVGEHTLKVADKTIPIGKTYKEHLLTTLNLLT